MNFCRKYGAMAALIPTLLPQGEGFCFPSPSPSGAGVREKLQKIFSVTAYIAI
jgi:hypothetical protein